MRYGFSLLLLLTTLFANAQRKNERWGYLRDSVTHEVIVLASVTNLNTNTTVMTSATGRFRIELLENQVLSFAAVGYHFDTIHYNKTFLLEDTLTLYLSPLAHNLGNVTVTTRGMSRYQLDSIERRKDFLGDVDYKIPTIAAANSGAGIALNLDRFSKREKAKRKAFEFFEANEKEAYINYRFPASIVTKYCTLRGEDLQQFMQQYRPTVDWLRHNTSEVDIMYYINDKLKVFFKR
ncbi:MAG: hypothetical protein ABI581_12825 [Sediminibacterium sp.]